MLKEKILEILANGPLTMQEITRIIMVDWKPPKPYSVTAYVGQALFALTNEGAILRTKTNLTEKNKYSLSK